MYYSYLSDTYSSLYLFQITLVIYSNKNVQIQLNPQQIHFSSLLKRNYYPKAREMILIHVYIVLLSM